MKDPADCSPDRGPSATRLFVHHRAPVRHEPPENRPNALKSHAKRYEQTNWRSTQPTAVHSRHAQMRSVEGRCAETDGHGMNADGSVCSQARGQTLPEIKILSTTAMKTSLEAVAPAFERTTGHTLAFAFAPSGRTAMIVAGGEANDVAIVTDRGIDELIEQGHIVAGTRTDLARSPMALAVQKGAPRPDISSAEKFREAMLAAKSLAMSNPTGGGQSGANLIGIFDRLGIAEAMKAKSIYGPGGPAGLIGKFLLRNEAEIGIQQLPELMAVPGIDIVGPLPPDIQATTVFSAGLSAGAKNADGAKALLAFLSTPAMAATVRSMGMETP
jgi:molybdate transport system substrate-binding protein